MSKTYKPNEGNLEEGVKPSTSDSTNPCSDACDEILSRIREGGIPITINPVQIGADLKDPRSVEITLISEFIIKSRIDFVHYKKLMDEILDCSLGKLDGRYQGRSVIDNRGDQPGCDQESLSTDGENLLTPNEKNLFRNGALFSSSKSYSILKYATEKYINIFLGLDPGDIAADLIPLPYIRLIEDRLNSVCCCECPIEFRPLFGELIWNYWHEEGMLVRTIHAIANRFQNKRSFSGKDLLGNLSLDPLRPLNNLLWGYIQNSVHRLTPTRRAFEYDHEYGLSLFAGKPTRLNTADSRSYFIQAFHNLLHKSTIFYREADNLMKVPDGFPVLNALREVHTILAEGAGNQFGDLPMTARAEMMIEQYLLSRGEIREFLGGRVMVPYDEPWMDRVDAMKALQGWPGTSISYYHDLAVFGEILLLSIRWISWSQINNSNIARSWALTFRNAIQRYVHSYQAVTGVDLSAPDLAGVVSPKALIPAYLIMRKAQRDLLMKRR